MRPAGCPSPAGPARALPPRRSRTSARRARSTGVAHPSVAVPPLVVAAAVAQMDIPAAARGRRKAASVRRQTARRQIAPTAAIIPRARTTPSRAVAATVVVPAVGQATQPARAQPLSDRSEAWQEARGHGAVCLAPLDLRDVVSIERPTAGASANRTVFGIGGLST